MKYWCRLMAGFLFLLFGAINALQAKEFDFRFNLKKGEKFEYVYTSTDKVDQSTQGNSAKIEQGSSFTFSLKVLKKIG